MSSKSPASLKRAHTSPHHALKSLVRQLVFVAVLALAGFILWPQRHTLTDSVNALRHASPLYTALALAATAITYLLAAIAYLCLVRRPVAFREMAIVQTATALTSRLAPIGIGTMGLTAWFLHRRKHSVPEALAVVTTNNAIGFVGHMALLAVLLHDVHAPAHTSIQLHGTLVAFIALLAVFLLLVAAMFGKLRQRIKRGATDLAAAFGFYRRTPMRLAAALAVSLCVSLAYVYALSLSAQALGLQAPFAVIFLIYTFSLFTGIITPTPGGLVGVEAGIVGGFVAYGYDARLALSVALLYRLVSYWVPLVPGFVALRATQRLR